MTDPEKIFMKYGKTTETDLTASGLLDKINSMIDNLDLKNLGKDSSKFQQLLGYIGENPERSDLQD